ncbi:MAG: polyamine ABC transporter ATP-binding protein [Anaerolineaceae bacterium 4572_5.1]|nr:MAG: polyamine ABC transporter ATP-binding protein [Anaerolineaceae bacterium 4572_5.1]
MSVNIIIKHAIKRFGDNTVISDISIDIKDRELFTLLGPSGCGKTTLLRMIAGFNTIEGGEFYFNAKKINDMEVSRRNIGMVFQNYAIFPHYSVRQNVEFGLRNRKLGKTVIQEEADKFLKLMQMYEYRDRKPEQLSGGQQQRVALARALVIKPDVLLMDEPLSNLDAKLRLEMRQVIRDIQKEVGITTVYVTHDQEEAMAISDRIAVMNEGVIQQVGTPQEIYHRPSNMFVATFIGRTNFLEARYHSHPGLFEFGPYSFAAENLSVQEDCPVILSVRPEDLIINKDNDASLLKGIVKDSIFLGLNTHQLVELSHNQQLIEIIRESSLENLLTVGEQVSVSIKGHKINVFSEDGKQNLIRRG